MTQVLAAKSMSPSVAAPPAHAAEQLTDGGTRAHIVLRDQVHILRITRAGKLILTK
jgi:hemin uptake protein HemP